MATETMLRTLSEQAQLVPRSGHVTGFSVVGLAVVVVNFVVGFAVVVAGGAGVGKIQAFAMTRRKGKIIIDLLAIFLLARE